MRLALRSLAIVLVALAACQSQQRSVRDYVPSTSKYDVLPPTAHTQLVAARELVDRDDLARAAEMLSGLARENPDNVALAIWLQEVQFAAEPADSKSRVGDAARELADKEPTVVHLLLSARLDPDAVRARATLDQALELDRDCAWTYYALAHDRARHGQWVTAHQVLDRALELDPGLVPARRLEAAMLARNGQRSEAIKALDAWLQVTRNDPLIDEPTRVMAQLDLAQLQLLDGQPEKAKEVLLGLADKPTEAVRRLCLLAAVEQTRGHAERALMASREAEARDASAVLPVVQQAILQANALDDPVAARRAWERVLELAQGSKDLNALILGLRARVALERAAPVGS